ncbi:ADP-ribosylation [Hesseltinella vesiculosa]|uniref:Poly [ADP-ribose] polymerase n=1 Tax=Hesseltinella vesiculosa TaxID=101127 RepID=A0A1X2GDF4_9FUNG|nr:ADP-ribosylation [Hesseltinella vesiculosa]
MLIQVSTSNNNNKFYHVECEGFQVSVRYGRVGTQGKTLSYFGGMPKYEQLLKAKRSKGYKNAQIEVLPTTDAGDEILLDNVIDLALKEITYKDNKAKQLVNTISEMNVHKITSTTSIKFDATDGMFKTPLGLIKRASVVSAMDILVDIENLLTKYNEQKELKKTGAKKTAGRKRKADGTSKSLPSVTTMRSQLMTMNEDYFMIIPSKIKNATAMENLLFSQEAIDSQRVICNALLETLDLIDDLRNKSKKKSAEDGSKAFNVEIETVKDKKILKEVTELFDATKNNLHGNYQNSSRVTNVYRLQLDSQLEPFKDCEARIGGVQRLWHGTRTENLLSIMSKGLLMPNQSPGRHCGSMFGPGLYFANQSTKSLNYCDGGYWTGNWGAYNKVYMFLASVAVGKHFTPTGSTYNLPPKGYDSYWAKPGTSGILNDEIIVFKGDQVRFEYLLEIER